MKKLMIAAASVAMVAGAYAEYDAGELYGGYTGFETDDEIPYASQNAQWINQSSGVITEYGSKVKPLAIGENTAGENSLVINNDEGALTRLLAEASELTGTTNTVEVGGIFIDTAVKFTAAETEPTIADGAQFALWLKAVDTEGETAGQTNLMVTCATYDTDSIWGKKSVALDVDVKPDSWHRVTIKPIADNGDLWSGKSLGCFLVYIDGTLVSAKEADYADVFKVGENEIPVKLKEGDVYWKARQLFPSMIEPSAENSCKLTSITFDGTGEIDMFTVTDEDPFPPAVTEVTLTITQVANCNIVVSNATEEVATGTKFDPADEKSLTVYRTPASGFELVDCEAVEVITMTEDTEVTASVQAITPITPAGKEEFDTEAEAKAKVDKINANPEAYISAPEGVETTKAYRDLFAAKSTYNSESGKYEVTIDLTSDGETTIQDLADANVADALGDGTISGVIPGLYYTFIGNNDVAGEYTESGTRILAETNEVTLDKPTLSDEKGFYRLKIETK